MMHESIPTVFIVTVALVLAVSLWLALLGRTTQAKHKRAPKLSPLTTGNGFGFAVLSTDGKLAKWYAHPYRFKRPGPDITKDGVPTANLLKSLSFAAISADDKHSVAYISESHLVSASNSKGKSVYFMPFDLNLNALVAIHFANAPFCSAHVVWNGQIVSDGWRQVCGRTIRVLRFAAIEETVLVVPLAHGATVDRNPNLFLGNAFAFLSIENACDIDSAVSELLRWQNDASPELLCARELASLESWRVDPESLNPAVKFLSDNERRLYRQNETFLRMAQNREPNNEHRSSNGLIVASLPDGIFFIHWVRDMVYAIIALIGMGHHREARQALLGLFNARPVGINKCYARNMDYQISLTRYFGDGTEEDDFGGLPTPNIEFDNWGLALWAVSEYVLVTGDSGILQEPTYRGVSVYESMRDFVIKPLLGNLDSFCGGSIVAADSSLWEESQINKRHHAYATTVAVRAMRGVMPLTVFERDAATLEAVMKAYTDLINGFRLAFLQNRVLRGTVEPSFKNEIDGSLIESLLEDVLVSEPDIIERTLAKMRLLLTASGGLRRVRGTTQYERQEFLFINFLLAKLYFRLGRVAEGNRVLNRMVKKACVDNGHIPEMYVSVINDEFVGEIGDPTGSTPMVGYGAGVYVLALLERAKN